MQGFGQVTRLAIYPVFLRFYRQTGGPDNLNVENIEFHFFQQELCQILMRLACV